MFSRAELFWLLFFRKKVTGKHAHASATQTASAPESLLKLLALHEQVKAIEETFDPFRVAMLLFGNYKRLGPYRVYASPSYVKCPVTRTQERQTTVGIDFYSYTERI